LGKKYKYIIYKVSDNKTSITVDKTSTETSYDTFLSDLPETEPRWAIYDFDYEKAAADGSGTGKRNKICFYSWWVKLIYGIGASFL
jgi:cofilin